MIKVNRNDKGIEVVIDGERVEIINDLIILGRLLGEKDKDSGMRLLTVEIFRLAIEAGAAGKKQTETVDDECIRIIEEAINNVEEHEKPRNMS